jgi:hypothetical protein
MIRDVLVSVDMHGQVQSLNASVSAGIPRQPPKTHLGIFWQTASLFLPNCVIRFAKPKRLRRSSFLVMRKICGKMPQSGFRRQPDVCHPARQGGWMILNLS